jgi:hypothetical protein
MRQKDTIRAQIIITGDLLIKSNIRLSQGCCLRVLALQMDTKKSYSSHLDEKNYEFSVWNELKVDI